MDDAFVARRPHHTTHLLQTPILMRSLTAFPKLVPRDRHLASLVLLEGHVKHRQTEDMASWFRPALLKSRLCRTSLHDRTAPSLAIQAKSSKESEVDDPGNSNSCGSLADSSKLKVADLVLAIRPKHREPLSWCGLGSAYPSLRSSLAS